MMTGNWGPVSRLVAHMGAELKAGLPGAGFYLNATADKWKKHYNMYGLVVKEIPQVLEAAGLGLVSAGIQIRGPG